MNPHNRSQVRWLARLLVLVIMLALPIVVFADIVQNDVSSSGQGTELELGEYMTVDYWIQDTFGDLQRGCNASDGTPATVRILPPPGLAAEPASLTFTACRSAQKVTFTPTSVGFPEIPVAVEDEGIGTYNLNNAFFTLNVVDTTPPTIVITTPEDGSEYLLNQVVYADYECTDLSPVTSCDGPVADGAVISTASVGEKFFTVNAKDAFDNSSSLTHNYSVIYDFAGFFAPIDNLPLVNAVKAGSAVPVKFTLHGDQGLDIVAVGYPQSYQIQCDGGAEVLVEETATSGQSSLSYDAAEDQYVYVWKTDKAWSGSCRQLAIMLNDGTMHLANFHFK